MRCSTTDALDECALGPTIRPSDALAQGGRGKDGEREEDDLHGCRNSCKGVADGGSEVQYTLCARVCAVGQKES